MATTGTVLVPMGVSDGLVVALYHRGPKPEEMKLVATVDGHDQTIPVTEWRTCHEPFGTMEGAGFELYAAKVKVSAPAATKVWLKVSGREGVDGSAWTPPEADTRRCTVAFGSCFGLRNDSHHRRGTFDEEIERHLTSAYEQLTAGQDDPVYHVWLGDQVYLDDPAVGLRGRINVHRRILERYADTWGLGGRSGFAHLLSRSTNWFLADDHEFWNGFPRANITMIGHTGDRLVEQARRFFTHREEPSHPFHQGPWGRIAGAAFMTFQSPSFDRDLNQFSDMASPFVEDRGGSQYAGVATFGSDSFTVALLDMRWNRTMLRVDRRDRHAGFTSQPALEKLENLLEERDHLVVLCLSRPIVGRPLQRRVVPIFSETAPEHYHDQYRRLLAAIEARGRAGRPTLILGGDVHEHSARLGLGGRVLEIVSSPLSLIESLDGRGKPADGLKGGVIRLGARLIDRVQGAISRPEPSWVSDGSSDVLRLSGEDAVRDGLAAVRIDTTTPTEPVVTYACCLSGLDDVRTATIQWRDQAWTVPSPLAADPA